LKTHGGPCCDSAGLFLYWIGEFATLYVLEHVSLWMVIVGLVIALMESRARADSLSSRYLLTSIPLPFSCMQVCRVNFNCGPRLSEWLVTALGVMAFREGNVIDLGPIHFK